MEARNLLNNDVIVSYTDIIYDEFIVKSILDFSGDIGLAVDMNWEEAYIGRTDHPIAEAANVMVKNNSILKIGHNTTKFGKYTPDMIGEFLGISFSFGSLPFGGIEIQVLILGILVWGYLLLRRRVVL